jgi:replicative DNA helicase
VQLKEAPNSQEYEESIISSMVMEPSIIGFCLENLSEESFYYDYTRLLYKSIVSLTRKRVPIDLLTVINETKEVNREKIVDICSGLSTSMHYKHYLNVIKEKENLRKIINLTLSISSDARSESDVEEILERIKRFDIKKLDSFDYGEWIEKSFKEKQTQIIDHKKNPLFTGIQFIDRLTNGLIPTEVLYVVGDSGIGKTRLNVRIMNFMSSNGHLCLFFSIEMQDYNIQRMIIELNTPFSLDDIDGNYIDNFDGVKECFELNTKKNLIIDSSPECTISYIRFKIKEISRLYKKKPIIMIDSFDQIVNSESDLNKRDADVSKQIFKMAQELRVPFIVVHHNNKDGNFRGSGKIKDNCDYMLSLTKEDGFINQEWKKTRFIRGVHDFESILVHEKQGIVEILNKTKYEMQQEQSEKRKKGW